MMTSAQGKNIVLQGWISAGITYAIQKGLSNLLGLNPFSDIDPVINLEAVTDKTAEDWEMLGVKTINDDDTDDDDDKEAYEIHSNAFDIFDDDFFDETGNM